MSAVQGGSGGQTPGPGWWMGSDGNLYPPEDHPDVRGATRGPVKPPNAGQATGKNNMLQGRSAAVGAVIALAVCATVAIAGFAVVTLLGRLPSPESDQERVEAALPDPSELPPGLVPIDLDENGQGDEEDKAICAVNVIPDRASASVGYRRPSSLEQSGLGDGGILASATSYESSADAESALEVATAPTLTSCFELTGITLTETTGGVEGADASRVFATEGGVTSIYVSLAQRDRFLVLVMTDSAEDSLEQSSKILEGLS